MDKPIRHREPARGKLAGIRADAKAAKVVKDTGQNPPGYNPQGLGAAWSHNFLNQKPWHPANFRNQAKVYEAEQNAIRAQKAKAEAKQEYEAEQEYIKTLSYLSAEEQRKYKERQSVSFMYQKPPGMDCAVAKPKEEVADAEAAGPSIAEGGAKPGERRPRQQDRPKSHVADMLGAMAALQQQERFEVKHVSGMGGRSPPRGGAAVGAANQQFLADSDEDNRQAGANAETQPDPKASKKRKLEEAEAFLRAAGLDPAEVARLSSSKDHKHKKSKKGHKQKDKQEKHKGRDRADKSPVFVD
ncbi:hypothetical protein ABBQ32_003414 [Trebouxia sp. C0010 RCD-2024]